jgi:RimJ/RimL family protein N-acetyltransferase
MTFVLETPRLRLRQMTLGDLDFVAEMLSHPEVMRFYPDLYDREEAEEWLRRQRDRYADDGHGLWLVIERATGAPVGQIGLCTQTVDGARLPEVAYLLHRPYWRLGYATEAAGAVRDHAFEALGYRQVISLVRPENLPSRAVAERLGMQASGLTDHAGLPHLVFSATRPTGTRSRGLEGMASGVHAPLPASLRKRASGD